MRQRVEDLVREFLRPLVEVDGGTIEVIAADETTVRLRLHGACAGCPGIHYTRTHVIEPLLRHTLGEGVEITVER